ncbi:MAG: putative rane protein, partial [Paenibacillus sp.]|nr:putative rane protein [Paenibacillus sp.]
MRNKKTRRMFAVTLILCMIVSMMPMWPAATVEAATADLEVMIEGSGTKVGNATIAAENALDVFAIPGIDSKGFEQTESGDVNIDYSGGNVYLGADDDPAYVIFTINVADNKTLREMAAGEEAEVVIGFSSLEYYNPALAPTERTTMNISISSPNYTKSYHTSSGRVGASEIVQKFNADSVIEVRIDGTGDYDGDTTGARGFYIKFQDTVRPEIENYTFKGNGEENYNKKITQTELYVKKNEYLDLSYHFTEMVKPTGLIKDQSDFFFKHRLFDNQAGTGLPAEGQTQYMVNQTYNNNNLGTYQKDLQFLYTGVQFHNSSNLPVPIRMGGSGSGDKNAIDYPLEQKIKDAKFADAAGNVAKTDFPFKAKSDSNSHLTNSGNAVDPFDYANGGYRVIVDAVPPKYTKTGNGIQPEILTGLTLNTNDGFDFTLQLTEEAMVKRAWRNEPPLTADKDKVVERTFLLLNNGMKAYYKSGENTDKWTFHLSIPDADGKNVEVPLLKVIALSHDKKNDDSDTGVIQDYAGNLLMQPANYEGIYPPDVSADDRANVNSKIDWANLSFDNTKPLISFHYESGDVTDAVYKQTDKITIDANDPAIKVPGLDPIYQPDAERPSRGIYRPSNVTGGGSPAVGLVYYMWSQSPANPLQYKDDDRFAAIKRYSLSGKQPKEGLYTDGFDNVVLSVANNKTNLLPPPPDALKPEKSGEWYLHAWTSDMTWDSARELMQYDKKKNYDPVKYAQLKAQAPAGSSDAD